MTDELTRRASAKDRVLARLQRGPATNIELNAICFRYGGRLHELKAEGVQWTKEAIDGGLWRYTLVSPSTFDPRAAFGSVEAADDWRLV